MFYELTQNNSFGYFETTETVCHRMIIEADSENQARDKAEDLGCYWDGVDLGVDCECCGDRWYPYFWELNFPKVYDGIIYKDVEEYARMMANRYAWSDPDTRIFYKDGRVSEHSFEK